MNKLILVILLTLSFASFSQATKMQQRWEVTGFSMPESVAASPSSEWLYVSNVNGDKGGYISRLSKDGKNVTYQWISGLRNPAGLSLFKDKLYVGDSSQLHIIDVKKGELLRSVTSKDAKALNDVTISKSGHVFVSDIATGKIFTLKGDVLEIWFEAPEINHPNGLLVQDNHLFVANYANKLSRDLVPEQYGSLYKISLLDKSYSVIPNGAKLGGLDGITALDNGLLVSSNLTGELFIVTDKERILVNTFPKGLADISMMAETLYAPYIFSEKVVAYHVISGLEPEQDSSTKHPEFKFKNIEVSRHQAVLLLRINVPPRNAVSKATLREIDAGLDIAAGDESIGAVVITGSDSVFSAGAGGESLKKIPEGEATHSFIAHKVYRRIEGFSKPVIAAITGISAGGGNELALSCDIRIAGDNARFRQHEIQAGLIPGFGGMQRLPRHVGLGRAMEIMLTGRFIEAEEALSIGLVTSVVPDAEVVSAAIDLGKQLSENLDRNAFAAFKKRMSESYDEPFSVALRNDQLVFDRIAVSEEAKAAIARFINKQKENKTK